MRSGATQSSTIGGIVQLRDRHRQIFYAFMWTSHVGSCVWYYLVRPEDPTIELAWSFEQRANYGELVGGGNPTMLSWWYLSGIYFTVVSLVSRSSPMRPRSATEMSLSLCIHVFG